MPQPISSGVCGTAAVFCSAGLRLLAQSLGELSVVVLREISANVCRRCGVGRVPQQRLAKRLDCLRIVRMFLQEATALCAGCGRVRQDATQRNLITRVAGILLHQTAKSAIAWARPSVVAASVS